MTKFLKKRWYLILLAIFFIGFVFYKNNTASKAKNTVDSYTIKRENLKEVLTLSGEIDATEKVTLRFQTSGRLAWVGVREGDYVKKYQGIAALDQQTVKINLEKALRDYSKERWDFEEDREVTYKNKALTDTMKRILEKNQFDLDKAVFDVELQSLSLEYASLWTPIEGIVTKVDVPFPGINITPAGADFKIINPKTIYFSATADQTEVIKLKDDMAAKISFDSYPEKTYEGKLYYIAFTPKQNETGTVYELRFKLEDRAMTLPLKMGMTGDLDIDLKEVKSVLSAPSAFIKKDNRGSYVKAKENGKDTKKYIKVGEEIDGKFIIINGLSNGDVIYD